jgi:Rieske Fe-S protein
MPRNSGKNFDFGGTPAVLVHQADGSFAAYNAICTHLGCTVQYKPELQRIWCACHGGQYDPATGKNVAGPPPRPLEAYRVKTKGSGLVVSLAAEDASGS